MLYMEDRSYEEMEDILGISQGNLGEDEPHQRQIT